MTRAQQEVAPAAVRIDVLHRAASGGGRCAFASARRAWLAPPDCRPGLHFECEGHCAFKVLCGLDCGLNCGVDCVGALLMSRAAFCFGRSFALHLLDPFAT